LRVIVASDHAGYHLKSAVVEHLTRSGIESHDIGVKDPNTSVDYTDFAQAVSRAVACGEFERGILVCGTGQGMVMAANKVTGIRAALCHDEFTSHQSRAHNNANVLCLGEGVVKSQNVGPILDEWFKTAFEGGVHTQRLDKLDKYMTGNSPSKDTQQYPYKFGISISPTTTRFGPIIFAGRLMEAIDKVASSGFSAIELSLRSPGDIDIEILKSSLSKNHLRVAAIATGQACIEDKLCLSNPEPRVIEKTIQHLKGIIQVAAHLEASVILGSIRGCLIGTPGEMAKQRSTAVESIRACAQYANDQKVTLLIEPINRYETNFINSSSDGMKFIEEIGEPSPRLLLDTFHMNIEEPDIFEAMVGASDHLAYVHVADSNRHAPGQGHIDFPKVLETLSLIGYKGIITAEILPVPNDEAALIQAGNYLTGLVN
jgi:RpiB/LacA/LacB family sugar-phosphate isomerase